MADQEEIISLFGEKNNMITEISHILRHAVQQANAVIAEEEKGQFLKEIASETAQQLLPYALKTVDKKQCTHRLEIIVESFLKNWDSYFSNADIAFTTPESPEEKAGADFQRATAVASLYTAVSYVLNFNPDAKNGALESYFTKHEAGGDNDEPIPNTLEVVESFRLNSFTWPNDPLTNKISQHLELPAIGAGPFDLVTERRRGKPVRTAYTVITFDDNETTLRFQGGRLDEYSRLVLGAMVSLWEEAEKRGARKAFTIPTIFRHLPGGNTTPTKQQREAVKAAIEKLRRLRVYIDLTDEIKRHGLKVNGSGIYNDQLINVREGPFVTRNGKETVQAFEILSEPFPLYYSRITGQLLSADTGYLEIREVVQDHPVPGQLIKMSPERQAITGYLLRRILVMKHDAKNKHHHQSNKILFDTLFDAAGITTTNRHQIAEHRNFCFQVLDYWKNTGLIKNYKVEQTGRKYTGIIISF